MGATFGAYLRLSGPGWLQSAITLGGGSLGSALYLGMLGGTGLLWVQLVAILIGVVMLSAISYVTLTSGERPYSAMNDVRQPSFGYRLDHRHDSCEHGFHFVSVQFVL